MSFEFVHTMLNMMMLMPKPGFVGVCVDAQA